MSLAQDWLDNSGDRPIIHPVLQQLTRNSNILEAWNLSIPAIKLAPLLETRELTKQFGGVLAVKNLSLKVESNEILGLIGPNGAGKTTVFNLITGFERPTSGDILFEGKSIRGLKPHSICKLGISRTYQNVRPFLNHTVRENISVGVSYGRGAHQNHKEEKIDEILDFLKLETIQNNLAKNLTIEQRKLVEVGRAIGAEPKLLLLDEPIAGLNPKETAEFVELIRKLKENHRNMTILIVEHVMKVISSACSRVIVLSSGEILSSGTPEEVLSEQKVVDLYLGESYSNPQS
jgi:branched-chain amino acid transport system ATP-binding protein